MNRLAITLLAIATLVGAVAIGQTPHKLNSTEGGPVGRYQLVTAEHEMIGHPAGPINEKVVLRIDTTTGSVDIWMSGVLDGIPVSEWVPTGTSPIRRRPTPQ